MSVAQPSFQPKPQGFATTHWTAIQACAQPDEEAYLARAELCRTYWYPIYARLRRLGHSGHDAEDLTQGFFADILDRAWFLLADQSRGRFRSFLLTSVDNFVRDEHSRSAAQKRGGGCQHVSLDLSDGEARYSRHLSSSHGPEQIYDMEWAASVVGEALKRLESEFSAAGKKALFDALKTYLTVEGFETPQESVATALGMTADAVKVNVHRMRKRYGALLREEVARTVAALDDVDEEMRHLRAAISNGLT